MENLRKVILSTALTLSCATALAQNKISASGTVIDDTGQPVIGATVMEKGTTNGTVTDIDGHFQLQTTDGSTLVISYVGYTTQEVKEGTDLKLELKPENTQLNEIVVTGYTTQRKADLTGAVSVVSTDALKTTPDADPMRALQGRVPGMTVTSNGSHIGTGTVRIRGVGSIAGPGVRY